MKLTTQFFPLIRPIPQLFGALVISFLCFQCTAPSPGVVQVHKDDHIVLIGNNLGSRMMNYGHFETEVQLRFPDSLLTIRNMCDGGNRPGFRPHSGRVSPWPFPGAETFQTELAQNSGSQGHFETPDQWLTRLEADIIIAFFGYNESFQGKAGIPMYEKELEAFIQHTQQQLYNGEHPPQLVLVSPIAFEDLSDRKDVPDGKQENVHLNLYTQTMKQVAERNNVPFIDVFLPTQKWFNSASEPLTLDGSQLTDAGYERFGKLLAQSVFGGSTASAKSYRTAVHEAVMEKNWFWHNDFKIPNGVHVFGRRYNPFGPDNYPAELKKIREMTVIRDQAIWAALQGDKMDIAAADAKTHELPPVETNFSTENFKKRYS